MEELTDGILPVTPLNASSRLLRGRVVTPAATTSARAVTLAVITTYLVAAAASLSGSAPCTENGYTDAFNYEVGADLALVQRNCRAQLSTLMMQQFGPPSAFEVFNMLCHGACRDLQDRLVRLASYSAAASGDCTCTDRGECPRTPVAMLCQLTGVCPDDAAAFMTATCSTTACGRWARNEADYRSACNL